MLRKTIGRIKRFVGPNMLLLFDPSSQSPIAQLPRDIYAYPAARIVHR